MKKLIALTLLLCLLLSGCGKRTGMAQKYRNPESQGTAADLGGDDKTYGDDLNDMGAYDGVFDSADEILSVTCVSGTDGAYKIEGSTLTFTQLNEDSVYSVSGEFNGNIIIDTGDDYKFDLELCGFSIICESTNPITVLSGDEVSVTAKKDTENYIYDNREKVDSELEGIYSGAVHSEVDLEICGKGSLKVVSENNNGIHSKDDLQVKNLTLLVVCADNALKGNDGVEIESGELTLIASAGDGIKTSSSKISEKGNQKGDIVISGGNITVYSACGGLDAAHNVLIDNDSTVLNVYTDKYSNYSSEVTSPPSDDVYYIRFTSKQYSYSIKYYNSDSDCQTVNATYHSSVSGGRSTYYYFSYPKLDGYDKLKIFIYSSDMEQGSEETYLVASDYLTLNTAYDTFALSSRGNQLSYSWTNYTTKVQEGGFGGPGEMGNGNTDKGNYSTKGIKASNEIIISGGTVNVKSYDDALHANNEDTLENGTSPLGNVTVNGGTLTLYSNDDGIHADGSVNLNSGTVSIINSYEGVEGSNVKISGGYLSVISNDDGINGTATSGTAVEISSGTVYIYCKGDGIDSNSRSSYSGIVFSGGNTVVISNSNGNSAIDTESGYSYTGGAVIAIMPRGGMANEATHCSNFSQIGKYTQLSLSSGSYLNAVIGSTSATVRIPATISAYVIILGDSSPSIEMSSSTSVTLDGNGVSWK